ncbi:MAG TPA: putative glycolipid-binding domain-containing protein [Chitinophaga sp.]|uniref:putative glycolipid-binding domain-containing protein n=1 Tax=Chitinophaga sp. TaxID=1869181 RepID=UPI002CE26E7B|nr:putative glycolipid-binding domain-containing protein [Chitinophaga sp.]HVI43229.1 putative glycolipid-binding domain-containing protein [Chitinophaga sp.]
MEPVMWQAEKWPGIEFFTLTSNEHYYIARGVINGCIKKQLFVVHYEIEITQDWKVSSFHIKEDSVQHKELKLTSDLHGHWFDKEGNHIPAFDECIDIDISLTPFTNTLPIRRSPMETGECKTFKMLYILLPEFELQKVEQRYTRLGNRKYLYENTNNSFKAEIPVDENDIVEDYPGIFKRLP